MLFSCANDVQQATDTLLLEQQQEHVLNVYSSVQENRWTFDYLANESSSPESQKTGNWYLHMLSKADSTCYRFMEYTNKLKMSILYKLNPAYGKSAGKDRVIVQRMGSKENPLPSVIDFTKVKGKTTVDLSIHKKRIRSFLIINRRKLCYLASLHKMMFDANPDCRFRPFQPPLITSFRDKNDLRLKLEKAINKQSVTPDAREQLIQLYQLLSFTDQELDKLLREDMDWRDAMKTVLAIEQKIQMARRYVTEAFSTQFSFCSFPFEKVSTFVDIEESSFTKGDSLTYSVCVGGVFELNSRPVIQTIYGKPVRYNEGVTTLKTVIPDKNQFELNGTITIFFSSGIPKTFHWSKIIQTHPKPSPTKLR